MHSKWFHYYAFSTFLKYLPSVERDETIRMLSSLPFTMARKSQQKIDRLKQTCRKSQITSSTKQKKKYKSTACQSTRRQTQTQQRKIAKPTKRTPTEKTKTPKKQKVSPTTSKCSRKKNTNTKQKQSGAANDNRLTKAISEVRIRRSQDNTKLEKKTKPTRPISPSLLGHSIIGAYTSLDYQSIVDSPNIEVSCSNDTYIDTESVDEPKLTNVEMTDASVQCATVMCDAATNTECDLQTLQSILTRFGARLRSSSHSEVDSHDDAILSDVSNMTDLLELEDSDGSLCDLFNNESDGISEISASPPQQKM